MSNAVSGRLVAGVLGALVVLGGTAAGAMEIGRRTGYRRGLEVARQEVFARVRADVEAASALRVGDARRAGLVLELSIDDGVRRVTDDAALAAHREMSLPIAAVGAARAYRRAVTSPDPQAAGDVGRLPAPEMSPSSPSLIALAMRGGAPVTEPDPVLDGHTLDARPGSGAIYLHYTTLRSLLDCPGQAGEMNRVWKAVVQPRVREATLHTVVLFPEDLFGLSASFSFTKSGSTWSAQAPCAVRITP
jgi:hypothetical protein